MREFCAGLRMLTFKRAFGKGLMIKNARWLPDLLILWILFAPSLSIAAYPVRIGVLSFRSVEQTQQRWQGLAEYLSQALPDRQFTIVPLYYPDLDAAVAEKQVNIVITNPQHYLILRQASGITPLVTLMPLIEGHPVKEFGGVIFT